MISFFNRGLVRIPVRDLLQSQGCQLLDNQNLAAGRRYAGGKVRGYENLEYIADGVVGIK